MVSLRSRVAKAVRLNKPLAMLAAASLVMLSATTPAHAADTTPLDPDPGPAGSFAWKGFNWEKRFWGGAPMFNKTFDASNVSNPALRVWWGIDSVS